MTQGTLNINLCMTFKLPVMKIELPLISSLVTVTSNNNTMYSKMRLVTEMFISNYPIIVFQINSIKLSQ